MSHTVVHRFLHICFSGKLRSGRKTSSSHGKNPLLGDPILTSGFAHISMQIDVQQRVGPSDIHTLACGPIWSDSKWDACCVASAARSISPC